MEPTTIESELDDYLKERTISGTTEPLDYWRIHKSLKKIARRFLTPPSSVESERIFSTMGAICVLKRWKLTGEHAKAFLHPLKQYSPKKWDLHESIVLIKLQ